MDVEELKRTFIRIDGQDIYVQLITWEGPHTPVSRWHLTARVEMPDPAAVEKAVDEVLANPKYFRTCVRCGEHNPVGWMHSEDTCQSCAEKHFGVVY